MMMVRFLEKLSNEDLKTFVAPFMTIDEEEEIKKMKEMRDEVIKKLGGDPNADIGDKNKPKMPQFSKDEKEQEELEKYYAPAFEESPIISNIDQLKFVYEMDKMGMFDPEIDEQILDDRFEKCEYTNLQIAEVLDNINSKERLQHLKNMVDQMKLEGITIEDLKKSDFNPENSLHFGEYN